jgi:PilZ domain-containing protein
LEDRSSRDTIDEPMHALALDRRRTDRGDRRAAPRAPLIAAVRDADAARLFLSQDLGARGMSVLRPEDAKFAPQTPLHVEFELPGGPFVRVLARVTSDRAGGRCRRTGLEFVAIDREQATLLDAFVRARK